MDPSGSAGFQIRISGWISRRRVERCACITQSRLTRAKRLRVRHAVDIKNICDFRICIFGFTIFHFRHISCVGAWPWAVGVIYTCSPDLKSDFEKKSKIRENRNEPRTHVQRTVCVRTGSAPPTHTRRSGARILSVALSHTERTRARIRARPHTQHMPPLPQRDDPVSGDGSAERRGETAAGDGRRRLRERASGAGGAKRRRDEGNRRGRRDEAPRGCGGWRRRLVGGGWRRRLEGTRRRRREETAGGRGGRTWREETL